MEMSPDRRLDAFIAMLEDDRKSVTEGDHFLHLRANPADRVLDEAMLSLKRRSIPDGLVMEDPVAKIPGVIKALVHGAERHVPARYVWESLDEECRSIGGIMPGQSVVRWTRPLIGAVEE